MTSIDGLKVSLVIPVKNEENTIENLYDSIQKQIRVPDEIVIVDGGSTDKTIEIIEKLAQNDSRIKFIKVDHAYPGTGRNIGIENSSYDIIAFTDAGITLDKKWLSELINPFILDHSVEAVFGLRIIKKDNFFLECLDLVYGLPYKKMDNFIMAPFIANSIIKKYIWDKVGRFTDFRAGEDHLFMDKIFQLNFKVRYNPDAIVYWELPPNFRLLFKHFSYYSYHDILSGRWENWHYPLARIYMGALIIIFISILFIPYLFFLLPVGFLARIYRKLYKKRAFKEMLSLKRISLSGLILLTFDLACFAGILKWILTRKNNT